MWGLSGPPDLASAGGRGKATLLLSRARSERAPTRIHYGRGFRAPHPGQALLPGLWGPSPAPRPGIPSSLWPEGSRFPVKSSWPRLGGANVSGGSCTEQSSPGGSLSAAGAPSHSTVRVSLAPISRVWRQTFSGGTLPSTGQNRDKIITGITEAKNSLLHSPDSWQWKTPDTEERTTESRALEDE